MLQILFTSSSVILLSWYSSNVVPLCKGPSICPSVCQTLLFPPQVDSLLLLPPPPTTTTTRRILCVSVIVIYSFHILWSGDYCSFLVIHLTLHITNLNSLFHILCFWLKVNCIFVYQIFTWPNDYMAKKVCGSSVSFFLTQCSVLFLTLSPLWIGIYNLSSEFKLIIFLTRSCFWKELRRKMREIPDVSK